MAPSEAALRLVIGPSSHGGEPVLRAWIDGTDQIDRLPLRGELCLTPLEGRWCTGWRDFERDERKPCPDGRQITRGRQCDRCRIEEGFYLCLTCDGTRCPALPPAIERYCLQTHRLYLADFGTGQVKVGTASGEEGDSRVVGQGPIAAAYVARGPGPQIKRLEKASSALGLTQQMTRRRKSGTAFVRERDERAARQVDEAAAKERIGEALATLRRELTGDDASALHDAEFVNLPPKERYEGPLPAYSIAAKAGETIRGEVRSVRGGFALLDVAGVPGVLDLGELRGRKVDLTLREAAPPPASQLSLFE